MELSKTESAATASGWLADFRSLVLARGQVRTYRKDCIVVHEGDAADSLYWIVAGELVAYVEDEDGRVLELSRMRTDEYFGELLFASQVRTASVRTVTSSKLCRISRAELEGLLMEHPSVALEIIRVLSYRLAALTNTVRSVALSDVYSRLRECLTQNRPTAGEGPDAIQASQQDLAERIGASRSMVNRLLKDLEEGGFVVVGRRSIKLLKPLPKRW